jgi:diguanylate cyclase (GGDEF)-like protein
LGLLILVIQQSNLFDVRQRGLLWGVIILVGLVLLRQYIVLRENVALFEEMRKLASTDSLTGLYNRHFFNEVFPFELKRAERHDRPLSILLIDINGFKAINDTFGHLKGDQILKFVARALAESLRGSDLIARFGGDEFIVILPETNDSSARLVAQRLKMDVAALRMENPRLGVSVGLAAYRSGISPEQLLEEADQDLYRQKTTVRGNRIGRLDPASYGQKQAVASYRSN